MSVSERKADIRNVDADVRNVDAEDEDDVNQETA